jgi:mRNA interferase RelE/StbE
VSEARRYTVLLEAGAQRDLKQFDRPTQRRIIAKIEALATNPRGTDAVKLAGGTDEYRVRVGQIRIVYQIADDRMLVLVLRIAKRDEVYKR